MHIRSPERHTEMNIKEKNLFCSQEQVQVFESE